MVVEFSNFEGSTFDGCSAHLRAKGSTFENGGVWRCFAKAVEKRGIDVRFENPAVSLVQDPFTKEVSGVIARRADGTEYSIKSAKGVLLACGGYENNLTMQRDFHGMETVYTAGTPGNTGDGIKMLMEAGAQIWHMKNQTQSGGFWLGIKVPEYDSTFMRNFTMAGNSWIEIDSESKRFYDEAGSYHRQHMKYMEYGRYVDLPHERALPVSLIFDEKTREAGSIGSQWLSWPTTTEGYTWSNDNLAEIEKGWIIKADTIEELAEKIDRDPAELQATIDAWNAACDAGVDAEFGRDPEKMAKIDTAPYYAVSIRTAAQTAFGAVSEFETVTKSESNGPAWADAADGVYTATVDGLHDKIEVSITVAGGKLENIEITGGRENMLITDEQLAEYVGAIIANQSADVDIVSGATVDCQAIGTAIGQAFAK